MLVIMWFTYLMLHPFLDVFVVVDVVVAHSVPPYVTPPSSTAFPVPPRTHAPLPATCRSPRSPPSTSSRRWMQPRRWTTPGTSTSTTVLSIARPPRLSPARSPLRPPPSPRRSELSFVWGMCRPQGTTPSLVVGRAGVSTWKLPGATPAP